MRLLSKAAARVNVNNVSMSFTFEISSSFGLCQRQAAGEFRPQNTEENYPLEFGIIVDKNAARNSRMNTRAFVNARRSQREQC